MKKVVKILGAVFLIFIVLIIVLPIIFKDEIKQAAVSELNNNINGEVYFGDIGVSLFSNFPNFSVSLDNFGVVGKDMFKGDTLADIGNFRMVVDLMSVISGEKYEIKKLILEQPRIQAKVLRDGTANWDIAKTDSTLATEEEVPDSTPSKPMVLKLEELKITKGYIVYDDRASDMYAKIVNLNLKADGEFTESVYDMATKITADAITYRMEGSNYLKDAEIEFDVDLKIDEENSKYTLEDNSFRVNALVLNLDGFVQMPDENITMDLKFNSPQTTFKNILSMVPGMYTADFDDIETDGTFSLDGWVKGTMTETALPGFGVNLKVADAWFQYPDLPEKVSNISMDCKVDCPDGDLNKMKINLAQFHADFGANPIEAKVVMSGVTGDNITMDANLKASLNLEQLLQMFPMEGQQLKGTFTIDAVANGVYNEKEGTFPKVNAKMALANGYYKTDSFPATLSNMNMKAEMQNQNGSLAETWLRVDQFHTELDGEPLDATMFVENFDDPAYQLTMKGDLDLKKLYELAPMENTEMAGRMKIDLNTKGTVSAIEREAYLELPTSGSMEITDFFYKDPDVPMGMKIASSKIAFDPKKLNIEKMTGSIGKSDFDIAGAIEGYLAYALLEDHPLSGTMTMNSKIFDTNEWLVEEEAEEPVAGEAPAEEDMEAFIVPQNIHFTFNSNIGKVYYEDLTLENFGGQVIIANGEVKLNNVGCNTLGGRMTLAGSYNTTKPEAPKYSLDIGIANMQIQKAYQAFKTVQELAPAAKFVDGIFNTTFNMTGLLDQRMNPLMETITAFGNLSVLNGKVSNFKVMDKIAEATKLNHLKEFLIDDTKIKFAVNEGRLFVEPFTVMAGNTKMDIFGSNGLDGGIDYSMNMEVPAGQAGSAAINAISGLTGQTADPNSKIPIELKIGGTVDDPKVTGVKSGMVSDGKAQIEEAVDEKIEEVKDKAKEELDKQKEEAQKKLEEEKKKAEEEAKAKMDEAKRKAEEEKRKAEEEAKRKADEEKARLEAEKKKAEEEAKKKLEEEKKKAKDLLKWPK